MIIVDLIKVDQAMKTIEEQTKDITVSVLINNAGGGELTMRPYCDWSIESETNTRDLNGTSLYRLNRLFLPHMLQRKKGYILNVSSLASLLNMYLIPYGSEKAKINAFTKSLACEVSGSGVIVQAHLFSAVWSEGFRDFFGVPGMLTRDYL